MDKSIAGPGDRNNHLAGKFPQFECVRDDRPFLPVGATILHLVASFAYLVVQPPPDRSKYQPPSGVGASPTTFPTPH
jgi:hypothetical protein